MKTTIALAAIALASDAFAGNWQAVYSSATADRLAINKLIDTQSVKPTDKGVEFMTLTMIRSLQAQTLANPPTQIYETSVAECEASRSYVKVAQIVTGMNFRIVESGENAKVTNYPIGNEAIDAMFFSQVCKE